MYLNKCSLVSSKERVYIEGGKKTAAFFMSNT